MNRERLRLGRPPQEIVLISQPVAPDSSRSRPARTSARSAQPPSAPALRGRPLSARAAPLDTDGRLVVTEAVRQAAPPGSPQARRALTDGDDERAARRSAALAPEPSAPRRGKWQKDSANRNEVLAALHAS